MFTLDAYCSLSKYYLTRLLFTTCFLYLQIKTIKFKHSRLYKKLWFMPETVKREHS